LVTLVFKELDTAPAVAEFYHHQYRWYTQALFTRMLEVRTLLTDLLAFFSILFVRYAFDNELRRIAAEKDNLALQLETLKAQLHPHFLFNTLNSIYGMSLTGAPETPDYILRLSDMMRYVLYDCQTHAVTLDKDLAFLDNYLEMEKKRYPQADIDFKVQANGVEAISIAPLLLIPFVENSFKHGSHRITDDGYIKGALNMQGNELVFTLENSALLQTGNTAGKYGGVGIVNVKKRLELYYPEKHTLTITRTDNLYQIHLSIQL
jgi:LytS/YehU family sensor histidine kinase